MLLILYKLISTKNGFKIRVAVSRQANLRCIYHLRQRLISVVQSNPLVYFSRKNRKVQPFNQIQTRADHEHELQSALNLALQQPSFESTKSARSDRNSHGDQVTPRYALDRLINSITPIAILEE